MSGLRLALVFAMVCGATLSGTAARAEPKSIALVIGNAAYTAMPPLPACARSARTVSAALKAIGFDIIERIDASAGTMDSGIADFTQRHDEGSSVAFVYVCGYGASVNDRAFVLPVAARISRPQDVLTQGILVKSLLDLVTRDGLSAALAVFDLIPNPDGSTPTGVEALEKIPLPDAAGIVAPTPVKPPDSGPTLFAAALAAALEGPVVRSDGVLNTLDNSSMNGGFTIAVLRLPEFPGYLAGAPKVPVIIPAQPEVKIPVIAMPDEARMTDQQRRDVQAALARLGLYNGPVHGRFDAATRTAIHRFQIMIGVPMSNRLAADQAARLVNGGR